MSYYDSVKDNVKNGGSSDDEGSSSSSASFDTLKEAAEETSNEEDSKEGDNTPIEVLEDGGLDENPPAQQKTRSQSSQSSQSSTQESQTSQSTDSNPLTQSSGAVEDKLDRIIEQNEKMIEILESFRS